MFEKKDSKKIFIISLLVQAIIFFIYMYCYEYSFFNTQFQFKKEISILFLCIITFCIILSILSFISESITFFIWILYFIVKIPIIIILTLHYQSLYLIYPVLLSELLIFSKRFYLSILALTLSISVFDSNKYIINNEFFKNIDKLSFNERIVFFQTIFQTLSPNINTVIEKFSLFLTTLFFIIKNEFSLNNSNYYIKKSKIAEEDIKYLEIKNTELEDKIIKLNSTFQRILELNKASKEDLFLVFFKQMNSTFKKELLEYYIHFYPENSNSLKLASRKSFFNEDEKILVKPIADNIPITNNKFYKLITILKSSQSDNFEIILDKNEIYSYSCNKSADTLIVYKTKCDNLSYIFTMFFKIGISPNIEFIKNKLTYIMSNIKNLIETQHELMQKTKQIDELQKIAYYDNLTGLFRRDKLDAYIDYDFKSTLKNIAVLMLDLDKFKHTNDTYGHQVGDIVIQKFGETIKNNIRQNIDIAIRYGGEEMLVIIESAPSENISQIAFNIAEKIREEMASNIFSGNGEKFQKTVSIGIYSNLNNAHKEFKNFYIRADEALYFSKTSGRNRCTIWHPNLSKE